MTSLPARAVPAPSLPPAELAALLLDLGDVPLASAYWRQTAQPLLAYALAQHPWPEWRRAAREGRLNEALRVVFLPSAVQEEGGASAPVPDILTRFRGRTAGEHEQILELLHRALSRSPLEGQVGSDGQWLPTAHELARAAEEQAAIDAYTRLAMDGARRRRYRRALAMHWGTAAVVYAACVGVGVMVWAGLYPIFGPVVAWGTQVPLMCVGGALLGRVALKTAPSRGALGSGQSDTGRPA